MTADAAADLRQSLVRGLADGVGILDEILARPVRGELLGIGLARCPDDLATLPTVLIRQALGGTRRGWAAVGFDTDAASGLIAIAMADEGETYDEVMVGAERDVLLTEIGNILLGGLLGGLAGLLGAGLLVQLPSYREGVDCLADLEWPDEGALQVRIAVHCGDLRTEALVLICRGGFVVGDLLGGAGDAL